MIAAPAAASGRLWLTNARLFDGTGAAVRDGAAVLIVDGEIARVGDARDATPEGARVIDLGGRTLMPGLVDAHAHVYPHVPTPAPGAEPIWPGTRRALPRLGAARRPADGHHDAPRRRLLRRPRVRGATGDAVRGVSRPAPADLRADHLRDRAGRPLVRGDVQGGRRRGRRAPCGARAAAPRRGLRQGDDDGRALGRARGPASGADDPRGDRDRRGRGAPDGLPRGRSRRRARRHPDRDRDGHRHDRARDVPQPAPGPPRPDGRRRPGARPDLRLLLWRGGHCRRERRRARRSAGVHRRAAADVGAHAGGPRPAQPRAGRPDAEGGPRRRGPDRRGPRLVTRSATSHSRSCTWSTTA